MFVIKLKLFSEKKIVSNTCFAEEKRPRACLVQTTETGNSFKIPEYRRSRLAPNFIFRPKAALLNTFQVFSAYWTQCTLIKLYFRKWKVCFHGTQSRRKVEVIFYPYSIIDKLTDEKEKKSSLFV